MAPNLTRYGLVEEANYFAQAAQLAKADKKAKAFAAGNPLDVKVKNSRFFIIRITTPILKIYSNIIFFDDMKVSIYNF